MRRWYLNVWNFYSQEEVREARECRGAKAYEVLDMSVSEWARYVEAGIATQAPKQRDVIGLIHFESYALQESSEILRETLANTRNYYYRGLRALGDFLNARAAVKQVKEISVLERNDARW